MKIALAQINPTVGDIAGNIKRIRAAWSRAARRKADLVVFPEMCVTGYPPRDLLEQTSFIRVNCEAVMNLARQITHPAALVGFVETNPRRPGKPLFNAAALLHQGRVAEIRHKSLLPTYDVFDEARYFEPSRTNEPIRFQGLRLGVSICEDIWNDTQFWKHPLYGTDPIKNLSHKGVDLFINISCSPFHRAKTRLRLDLMGGHIRRHHRPFLFVNQVGGNDELIFDGNSLALDAEGGLLAQGKSFAEDLVMVDTRSHGRLQWRERSEIAEVHDALVLGLRDYARKCGFEGVLMGLSGGIDSAVTAAIAVEALGRRHVLGVSMPSLYSSQGSRVDANALARNLGIRLIRLPITPLFKTYLRTLRAAFGSRKPDVTEENLQARIRGTLLMALSNKLGLLLLSTANKSEQSVGYSTLYGDMNGGLSVISDVPKITVYALGRYINRREALIPEASFTKPPSAELRPNQTDQDSLPPYEILDALVEAYIEEGKDVEEIVQRGYPEALVRKILNTIDRTEYKRRQAPPGLRITPKAFGIGRRMPIARGDFRV